MNLLKKIIAGIVFFTGVLIAVWIVFHVGFYTGYHTREDEYGTIQSIEQRGLIK